MIKFLIITQPRTGTAWFMSCLNSHPQIYCPRFPTLFSTNNLSPVKWFKPHFLTVDNPISPYYKYRASSLKRQIAHRINRNKLIYDFLSDLYAEHHNASAVGFKVNYSQIKKYQVMLSWIKQNDIKIIHLVRNNLLKRLVSHQIAHARNLMHSTQPVETIKVHIDPEILITHLRKRQRSLETHRKLFSETLDVPFLQVSYESLFADHDTETHKVLTYLGIDKFLPLTSEFVKVNPDSLEDIIENYSEVKQTLIGTEFEKFLQ